MLATTHVQVQNQTGQARDVWIAFEQKLAPKKKKKNKKEQKWDYYNDRNIHECGILDQGTSPALCSLERAT